MTPLETSFEGIDEPEPGAASLNSALVLIRPAPRRSLLWYLIVSLIPAVACAALLFVMRSSDTCQPAQTSAYNCSAAPLRSR